MAKKKMLNVEVKRSRWHRGDKAIYESALRMDNGHQCCLGFACRAAGFKVKEIVGMGLVSGLFNVPPSLMGLLENDGVEDDLVTVNDTPDSDITPAQREKKIKSLGKEVGISKSMVPVLPLKGMFIFVTVAPHKAGSKTTEGTLTSFVATLKNQLAVTLWSVTAMWIGVTPT